MNDESKKQLKVCVVGAGMIFQTYHLPAILGNNNLKLTGIVDRNVDIAKTVGDKLGVPYYENIEDAEIADICLVATPANIREQIILPALKRNMHVFCEKPFALNVIKANLLVQAAHDSGKKIFVSHNRRFSPNIQVIRKFIRNDLLGENMEIYFLEGGAYKWASVSDDRARYDPLDFGIIHDTGSHIIDLIAQFLDDLNISNNKVIIEKAIFEREDLPNDFYGKLRCKSERRSVDIFIKISRSVSLSNQIILRDKKTSIVTRSYISNYINMTLKNADTMRIYTNLDDEQPTNVMSTFYEQWKALIAELGIAPKSKYYTNIEANTVLPAIKIIDDIIACREVIPLDPYFLDGIDKWI